MERKAGNKCISIFMGVNCEEKLKVSSRTIQECLWVIQSGFLTCQIGLRAREGGLRASQWGLNTIVEGFEGHSEQF